jgi:hypothetical protein
MHFFLEAKKLILRREYNGYININPIIRTKAQAIQMDSHGAAELVIPRWE